MPNRLEPSLNMLSGLLAEPVAGWAGLLTANPENVERTRNALTYQPRTVEGKQGMNRLAGLLGDAKEIMVDQNPPVAMAVDGYNLLADKLGDLSPLMGAAAKTMPDAVGLLAFPGSRAAFGAVGKGIAENTGKTGMRGPLAAQDGMIGFKAEPTDPLRLHSEKVRQLVRRQLSDADLQALAQYGSPDDAPLTAIMELLKRKRGPALDGVPVGME